MRAWFYRHAAPAVLGAIGNVGISVVCFSGSAVNYPRFTLTLLLEISTPVRPIFPSPISVTGQFPLLFDDFLPMEPMEPMEGFRNRPPSAKIASP
jgi:hypothetical protein